MTTIYLGSIVQTLMGETDCDENDNERITAPRTYGYIEGYYPGQADSWSVVFTNGASVFLANDDLNNTALYRVIAPSAMANAVQRLGEYDEGLNEQERAPEGNDYNNVAAFFLE